MERAHAEDAFAGGFEGDHLDDHRPHLDDEHQADEQQDNFFLQRQRNAGQRRADGQRAGIAHEHLRGMMVVAEKRQAGRAQGGGKDGDGRTIARQVAARTAQTRQ